MVLLIMLAMAVSAFAAPRKCIKRRSTSVILVLPQGKDIPADADGNVSEFRCANSAVVLPDSQEETAFLPPATAFYRQCEVGPVHPGYSGLPYAPPRFSFLL